MKMKTYLLLALLGSMLCGCNDATLPSVRPDGSTEPINSADHHFAADEGADATRNFAQHTIRIDGCQYLLYGEWNNRVLTHKGNCDNPYHKDNQR